MYGSKYYNSRYYASNYYRPDKEEEVDRGFAGGGGISGKARRLLKQIEQEDEIIVAFVSAFLQTQR